MMQQAYHFDTERVCSTITSSVSTASKEGTSVCIKKDISFTSSNYARQSFTKICVNVPRNFILTCITSSSITGGVVGGGVCGDRLHLFQSLNQMSSS